MELKSSQIGRCGELFVQYSLLLSGIESAPMTTDSGIDLVAYAPRASGAVTIQVKANLKAKPSGGTGKDALDWWLNEDSPAKLVALVDLSAPKIWLFTHTELASLAQQKSNGKFHIYMYTDPTHRPRAVDRLAHAYEFEKYLLGNRVHELFGI